MWLVDEFCATLDRVMARVVAYLFRKVARRLGKTVVVATAHDDLVGDFQPDIVVVKGFEGDVEVVRNAVEPLKEDLAGATNTTKADIKGKIVEHLWYLKKQGYKPSTIKLRARILKTLTRNGANLLDPESVKDTIANMDKSESYKVQLVAAYHTFITHLGMTWPTTKLQANTKTTLHPPRIRNRHTNRWHGNKNRDNTPIIKRNWNANRRSSPTALERH